VPGLPDFGQGWIQDAKIRHYLLSTDTPKGKSRHDFFTRFGFSTEHWPILKAALLAHVRTADVELCRQDQWGTTFQASGRIATPDGRNPIVIAFWIVRSDDPRPQLTSVVPSD
jgi:Domain of unknown function (DUF6883)